MDQQTSDDCVFNYLLAYLPLGASGFGFLQHSSFFSTSQSTQLRQHGLTVLKPFPEYMTDLLLSLSSFSSSSPRCYSQCGPGADHPLAEEPEGLRVEQEHGPVRELGGGGDLPCLGQRTDGSRRTGEEMLWSGTGGKPSLDASFM